MTRALPICCALAVLAGALFVPLASLASAGDATDYGDPT
jgi:hypothetical protein